MCRSERSQVDAWIINKVKFQTAARGLIGDRMNDVQQRGLGSSRAARRYKVIQSKSMQRVHEDRPVMPDQRPFKSKFLNRSPGPAVAECEGGLEAASAWHDNQKSNSNPRLGAMGCGDK